MTEIQNRELLRQNQEMVETQVRRRGISDSRLLSALCRVPRNLFVPEGLREYAFTDRALSIEEEQTISQPYIVALMLHAARLQADDKVLDVGTGSGYAAAVASLLVRRVVSIERLPGLARSAQRRLEALGFDNVEVHCGDGTLGYPEEAPYDAILVAASGPTVPEALKKQLALGGRLVLPVGDEDKDQKLLCLLRKSRTEFMTRDLGAVRFVPLVGEQAWPEG